LFGTALALILISCGGPADQAGGTSAATAGARKLPGNVCDLLTPAEVEAVLNIGQQPTGIEAPPSDSDRSCVYAYSGAPFLALSVQGERESVDWSAIQKLPGSAAVSLRGADASYWPTTSVLYVHKNGLVVVIQVVVAPAGETIQTAEVKLAQPLANRMP
jgi:hypothetical protein